MVSIAPGTFDKLTSVRLEAKTKEQVLEELEQAGNTLAADNMNKFDVSHLATELASLKFTEKANLPITVDMKVMEKPGVLAETEVYRISGDYSAFARLSSEAKRPDRVVFETREPGNYAAKNESDYSVLIGSLVGVVILVAIVAGAGVFLWRNPKYVERVRYTATNAKLSFFSKV